MDTIVMIWMMLTGLFHRFEFESKEDFWEWFWEREFRGYGVTLFDHWLLFKEHPFIRIKD